MNSFGLYLHSLRKKAYLTQNALAELLGVSPQAVSNWERDLSLPDVQFFLPLAKILDTTIERMIYMMVGEYSNGKLDDFLHKRAKEKAAAENKPEIKG